MTHFAQPYLPSSNIQVFLTMTYLLFTIHLYIRYSIKLKSSFQALLNLQKVIRYSKRAYYYILPLTIRTNILRNCSSKLHKTTTGLTHTFQKIIALLADQQTLIITLIGGFNILIQILYVIM